MAIFCPAGEACFPYGIQYKNGAIQLLILQTVPHDNSYVRWLIDKVIPKIKQWATEDEIGTGNIIRSLRLISTEKYSQLYLHLKRKYGNALTKVMCFILNVQFTIRYNNDQRIGLKIFTYSYFKDLDGMHGSFKIHIRRYRNCYVSVFVVGK